MLDGRLSLIESVSSGLSAFIIRGSWLHTPVFVSCLRTLFLCGSSLSWDFIDELLHGLEVVWYSEILLVEILGHSMVVRGCLVKRTSSAHGTDLHGLGWVERLHSRS